MLFSMFTTKSKQIWKLSQKRGSNGYTGLIGYIESE